VRLERILIATDLSESSLPELEAGLALTRATAGEAIVLNVLELWVGRRTWLAMPTREEIEVHERFLSREEGAIRKKLEASLAGFAAEGAGTARAMVRDGHAAEVIAAVANELGVELIVIGTRGRPETLGSVAEHVVRTARRPVLVIPAVGVPPGSG
jgi:nucleotide-binding universal stress UspA family protein